MERTKEGEFCWADLMAKDLEVQTTFYEKLFGWTHEDAEVPEGAPPYRMFQKSGKVAAAATPITPDMEAAGVPSMWNVYFATPDADAALARATELGGQVAMPAMDAMNSGRFAGIQDPVGGHFFVWQAGPFKSADVFMEAGSLSWVDLTATDAQKAIDFYTGLFPTWQVEKVAEDPSPYWQALIDGTGEAGIMPMPPQMPEGMPSNWMLYFGSDDARATVDAARELGATVSMDVTVAEGFVEWAVLEDPMGAVFAVLKPIGM